MATDNTLLLGFLFVIAAGIGWAVARYTQSGRVEERAERKYARRYFEGLNFLLDEQPDKAAEVFASMAGSEEEDIDVQFALGHIFRRRGEVQRAIQIHQNLLARPGLSRSHRDRALYGLADDYLKAGLLDRAESLFEEVSGSPTRGEEALRKLIRIYEQEREWQQAVAAQNRLASISRRDDESVVAHYYCELAEQAEAAGDLDKARELLQRARHADRDSPRGRLMRARIAARQGIIGWPSGFIGTCCSPIRDLPVKPCLISRQRFGMRARRNGIRSFSRNSSPSSPHWRRVSPIPQYRSLVTRIP